MFGIGIDLVEIERVRAARHFDRLSEYVLGPSERRTMEQSRDRTQYLASRFALKEAVIKAFPRPLTFQDIEVRGYGQRPEIAVQHVDASSYRIDVSLSHTESTAVAVAIVSAV